MQQSVDTYLPAHVRAWVEQRYYGRVNEQAKFEILIHDQNFWEAPQKHVGLFSDHGVVHVRDVAQQIIQVLDTIHGLLIPARPPERFEDFMKGYGAALAYLHDIGMADFSAFGRAMHPEFAAQAIFTPEFDELIEALWLHDCGGMTSRLQSLARSGDLAQPPEIVFREMLSLSMAHSKSKVPIAILNDPAILLLVMQKTIATDLQTLYVHQRQHGKGSALASLPATEHQLQRLSRYYASVERDAFRWLTADGSEARALVEDVVDTLRALRSADALRQRGTVQKTSGGYEVFISQQTGGAVYALRLSNDQLYLLETDDHLSAGEANIASSELDSSGNLRISFHRGSFSMQDALVQAVIATVKTVQDIRIDVIESFRRPAEGSAALGLKSADAIETWLESTDDNPDFVDRVCAELRRLSPDSGATIETVPSLKNTPDLERNRYLAAADIDWEQGRRHELLQRMALSGYKTQSINPVEAFRYVRQAHLCAGETLIEAGAPASTVYIPLGDGLRVVPLGGYASFSVRAWMPLGNTGVIRGALRNATVIADQDVSVLMIPRDVYLRHWHHTYTAEEMRQRMGEGINVST